MLIFTEVFDISNIQNENCPEDTFIKLTTDIYHIYNPGAIVILNSNLLNNDMNMTISIQFVKMPGSEALITYTTKKLQKLGIKYDWIINAEVFFKITKNDSRIVKICEVELSAPGPRIFASASEKNFEIAVKETVSELEKQLKKRKSIMTHH